MERNASPAPVLPLTSALARGDDAAWAQFHRDYGPALFRQLLAATRGDYDLASEALQQTYLRVARYARPCDVEIMFSAWLRVVARSALSDCRRRRKSFWQLLDRRQDDPSERVPPDEVEAQDARLQSALHAALAQLDANDRALLEAKYFTGVDVRQLAEQLGISAKATESRLTRARSALRHHLTIVLSRDE